MSELKEYYITCLVEPLEGAGAAARQKAHSAFEALNKFAAAVRGVTDQPIIVQEKGVPRARRFFKGRVFGTWLEVR